MNTNKIFIYSMTAAIGWTTGKALIRFMARAIIKKCEAENLDIDDEPSEFTEPIMEVTEL